MAHLTRPWMAPVMRWFVVATVVSVWILLFFIRQPDDGLGTDFYPLYRASQTLLAGENPYGSELTEHLTRVWRVPYAAAGFAYPLPAVIGVWPLLMLPLPIAIFVWLGAGTILSAAAVRLRSDWRSLILLPFCFMPLHNAVIMKQATLLWFACIVLLLWAMRGNRGWLAGFCIALLPAKPQAALLFALLGVVWAWQHNRRALWWAGFWTMLIWGTSFLIQPSWVHDWLGNVSRYNEIVYTASLLPGSLVLLALTWRLPWYAQLGAAQIVLFPVTDVYSVLPLLLTWIGIGGPIALIGSSISWLGILVGLPNSLATLWATTMIPLMVCAGWRLIEHRRSQRTSDTRLRLR